MITLRQLRYLSALAKHGHFGRAAEACAVTQPACRCRSAISSATLGVAVVERRPGDVMLTDVGREIARRGRGRAHRLARPGRFRPPSQRPADRAADARGDPLAGALSAAADSPAAAEQVSGFAAGIAGDPNPATGRGDQERRARCRDAGASASASPTSTRWRCSRICSCSRCRQAIRARTPRGSPPTISIRAG